MPEQNPMANMASMPQNPGMGYGYYGGYPYVPYSSSINAQQRLQQMEQMYPHLSQQYQPQPPIQPQAQNVTLKGRAVTCIDEAKASNIDFDGSLHVFTDIANGKIYTKQLGNNGTSEFNVFALQPKEEKAVQVDSSNEIIELKKKVNGLEEKIKEYGEYVEVFVNGIQSNANHGNVAE